MIKAHKPGVPVRMVVPDEELDAHRTFLGIAPAQAAHVEIIEPLGAGTALPDPDEVLLPWRMLVNGTDLGLIAKDGVKIDPGSPHEPATVTVTLLIGRLEIKAAHLPLASSPSPE